MAAWIPLDGGHSVDMPVRVGALSAGDPVEVGVDGVIALTDGGSMFGICASDGAVAAVVSIWRGPGRFQAVGAASASNFDRGDHVYSAGSNTIDGGSSTNRACGIVVDADPALAGKCIVDFDPFSTFAHA